MRISIQPSANLNKEDLKLLNKLKEGDVIKGKIVDVNGNIAKIELANGETAYAKLEIPLSQLKDKLLNFVIKDIKDNILFLTPEYEDIDFNKEFVLKNEDLIMDRILNLNNLPKSEVNINIIKNMIAFRMPLSSENIKELVKDVNKLLSMMETGDNETIHIISSKKNELDENISKFIKFNSEDQVDIQKEPLVKDNLNASKGKEDIKGEIIKSNKFEEIEFKEFKISELSKEVKNIDVQKSVEHKNIVKEADIDKNTVSNREYIEGKDVTEKIKKELKSIFKEFDIQKPSDVEDIIQKLVFLKKSDINVSPNNLKRLVDIIENGQIINKDLKEVVELLVKENVIDETQKEEIMSKIKSIELKFDGNDDNRIKQINKDIKDDIDKIFKSLMLKEEVSEKLISKVEKLNDSIEFSNKINNNTTFIPIPLTLNAEQAMDKVYVLSKRKVSNKSDNIKVYISLETDNLKNVKVLCDFMYDRLSINFKIEEEFMEIFENGKEELKNILKTKGYDDVHIYINKSEEDRVLNMISDDDSINYMINIKV